MLQTQNFGSNVYRKTKISLNYLHFAAYNGHLKMCKNLLQNYNFIIYARDNNGRTVLHIAAKSGDIKLLQNFIEKGSNVYSKTKKVPIVYILQHITGI